MHDSLVRELEGVARDREEATPDIDFPDAAETCYQWKCEELHNHFRPHEADRYPMAIDQREYWELEYLHYLDALQKRLLHKARDGVNGEPTADHWRSLASLLQEPAEAQRALRDANQGGPAIDRQPGVLEARGGAF